jgi:hypothetical protein
VNHHEPFYFRVPFSPTNQQTHRKNLRVTACVAIASDCFPTAAGPPGIERHGKQPFSADGMRRNAASRSEHRAERRHPLTLGCDRRIRVGLIAAVMLGGLDLHTDGHAA